MRQQLSEKKRSKQQERAETVVPGILSVDGAAKWLGYSRSTIYAMIADGDLRSFTYRRRRCIPVTECERFRDEQIARASDEAA
jgi:excisionase family DNA binding protein